MNCALVSPSELRKTGGGVPSRIPSPVASILESRGGAGAKAHLSDDTDSGFGATQESRTVTAERLGCGRLLKAHSAGVAPGPRDTFLPAASILEGGVPDRRGVREALGSPRRSLSSRGVAR